MLFSWCVQSYSTIFGPYNLPLSSSSSSLSLPLLSVFYAMLSLYICREMCTVRCVSIQHSIAHKEWSESKDATRDEIEREYENVHLKKKYDPSISYSGFIFHFMFCSFFPLLFPIFPSRLVFLYLSRSLLLCLILFGFPSVWYVEICMRCWWLVKSEKVSFDEYE